MNKANRPIETPALRPTIILMLLVLLPPASFPEPFSYCTPLYATADQSGKFVSQLIDAEMKSMMADGSLGRLDKIDFTADTIIRRLYWDRLISRDGEGFLFFDSFKKQLDSLGISKYQKLLVLYDITINQYVFDENASSDGIAYAPGLVGTIANAVANYSVNDVDTIWCRFSIYSFNNPPTVKHFKLCITESTCNYEPDQCLIGMLIQANKEDKSAGTSGKTPASAKIAQAPSPHWGMITCGVLLMGAGTAFLIGAANADSRGEEDIATINRVAGFIPLGIGGIVAIIGTGKQMEYAKFKKERAAEK